MRNTTVLRLGVVSFLNARPLIEGLDESRGVQCLFDVPAELPSRLDRGEVDAALIPIVDVLRGRGRYRIVSDACIGCDGETMTVRVFSQVPPDRIRTLSVDPDSHTSVALARILWRDLYNRDLELKLFEPKEQIDHNLESVLLIGDKVVDPGRGSFAYEVDLGGAWRQHTGLPFVFAVWTQLAGDSKEEPRASARAAPSTVMGKLATILSQARDQGVASAADIATEYGPLQGWPVAQAKRYLTRCLSYTLDQRSRAGANLFAQRCAELGLTPAAATIPWPEDLLAQQRL